MTTLHTYPDQRIKQLLARLRSRQLDRALRGDVDASARYAQRVDRVRQYGKGPLAQA
ncbi:MAG: hypothetical protein AAGC44_03960 [Planctomycetota bacterium]